MRLNRTHKRPLEYSIGHADRDPMFAAHWYEPGETLTPPTAPVQAPGPQWDLAPLPPRPEPSELEARWKAALEKADAVVAEMWKQEAVYDPVEMLAAVSDVIHTDFTPDDVLAAYRKRMEAKRG